MKEYIIINFASVIIVAILEYFSKQTSDIRKVKYYSLAVVLFVIFYQSANTIYVYEQDTENNKLQDSVDAITVLNRENQKNINIANSHIDILSTKVSDLRTAIANSNYRYDSITKELVPIEVKADVYLSEPRIHGGNNQFGNGNTQNN